MTSRPVVLVVAMADSVHTARWMAPLRHAPFLPVLLPVGPAAPVAGFGALAPVSSRAEADALPPGVLGLWDRDRLEGPPDALPAPIGAPGRGHLLRGRAVLAAIAALRPALLHAMEVQHAGYACLAAARMAGAGFPPWLVSNWGSDFQLYRVLDDHRPVLAELASRMDFYLGECARDLRIARDLGHAGPVHAPIPASGGMDFSALPPLDALPPPSLRRDIVVKGYHGWSGRALHVLSAVHLAAPALARFRIRIVLAPAPVAAMAAALREADGIDITVESHLPDHAGALARLADARMTIGAGISDGIGTTSLEAMAMGSFPLAGASSCAGEWIACGRDGFLLDPHDTAGMAAKIVRAATEDALVDAAAIRNRAEVERRWNASANAQRVIALYETLLRHQRR